MDIDSILKKASLSLYSNSEKVRVQSKFYFTDRGNLGLLFIVLISLFLMYVSLFIAKELGVQVFLIILSTIILVFAILTILKQLKDFVEVSRGKIHFSNSLIKNEIELNSDFKIKMKSEIIHAKTKRYTSGSYFCIVELFLKINGEKFRVLDYQVDEKDSKEAKLLGKEIKRMIFDRANII